MSDWDDWEDVFFDDEFDEEFETSRKIIIAVSSTIGAIVLLTILGLCAFGCCGSYFAIRQLREYRERNRRPQQNAPAPTFHQSNPSFNPSAPYNHGSSPYPPPYGQYPANVSTNYNSDFNPATPYNHGATGYPVNSQAF